MNDLALLEIQAETLFTYDQRGRTLRDNVPEGGVAPRLFVGRTLQGDIARFSAALPEDVVVRLAQTLTEEPIAHDLQVPLLTDARLRAILAEHAPVTASGGGPTFVFPAAITPPDGVTPITAANRDLVREGFPDLYRTFAAVPHCFAVVRDGAAVSVCLSSRIGPRAIEAEVETLPAFRGHGYAAAVTAAWALAVRAAGGVPLYTTSWENVGSRGVARRLGLNQYATDLWWA